MALDRSCEYESHEQMIGMNIKHLTYHKAKPEDLPIISRWIVNLSQDPARHCIHSWAGEPAEEIESGLETYFKDGELVYMLLYLKDKLIGTMGAEFDTDMACAWLHGPLVDPKYWESCTTALYDKLLVELPPDIKEFRAYLNTKQESGIAFYHKQGFVKKDHPSFVYQLTRICRVPLPSHIYTPLEKEHENDFIRLFNELFPNAYYPAERLIEMKGESHEIFITMNRHTFAGFVVISKDEHEIQFLGVEPSFRKQGYGKLLLSTGINYLFDTVKTDQVDLNVNGELENAQRLYESVGFKLMYSGIGLTKKSQSAEH